MIILEDQQESFAIGFKSRQLGVKVQCVNCVKKNRVKARYDAAMKNSLLSDWMSCHAIKEHLSSELISFFNNWTWIFFVKCLFQVIFYQQFHIMTRQRIEVTEDPFEIMRLVIAPLRIQL